MGPSQFLQSTVMNQESRESSGHQLMFPEVVIDTKCVLGHGELHKGPC